MSMQRNVTLDLFKGLAILSTLYIHAAFIAGMLDSPLDSKINILSQIGLINVPLFFFLSGTASTSSLVNFKNVFLRLFKLYVPYAIAILVFIVALSFFHDPFPQHIFKYFILQVHLMPSHFVFVISSMWFYPNFFLICLTTPILLLINRNKNLSIFFIVFFVLINSIFSFNEGWGQIPIYSLVNLHFFLCYLLFYFLGIYLKDIVINGKEFCCMFLALFLLFIYTLKTFNFASLHILSFPPKTPLVVGSLLPVLLFLYLKQYDNKINILLSRSYILKFLHYNGKHVLTIYLYQGFICAALMEFIMPLTKISNPYLLLISLFLIILMGTYPLVFIFNKINNLVLIQCLNFGNISSKKIICDQIR